MRGHKSGVRKIQGPGMCHGEERSPSNVTGEWPGLPQSCGVVAAALAGEESCHSATAEVSPLGWGFTSLRGYCGLNKSTTFSVRG